MAGDAAYSNYKFQKAIDHYKKALSFVIKAIQPKLWAEIKIELGNALNEKGIRAESHQTHEYLKNSVAAYRKALQIRTYEFLPLQWAQTKYNLAETYNALEEWENAAKCYSDCLAVYPNSQKIINQVSYIYHEKLFEFEKAYEMDAILIKLIKELGIDDLSVEMNFIEKQFTTGRFKDMEKRISNLLPTLKKNDVEFGIITTFDIAGCMVGNKKNQIPKKLKTIISSIQSQSKKFNVGWIFDGTKHFIKTTSEISDNHRQWLASLFSALEENNRDDILEKLRQLKK